MDGKTAEMIFEGQQIARKLDKPICKFREIVMRPKSTRNIEIPTNETWLVYACDTPIAVRSELGVHNRYSPANPENVLLHEGMTKLENYDAKSHRTVQFLIAHWKN